MSKSVQEEILAALYLIAALLAFQFGPAWLGWACAIKAGFDTIWALLFAFIEAWIFVQKIKQGGGNEKNTQSAK
jgi:hypothetical protein